MSYNFYKKKLKPKTDELTFDKAAILCAYNCERIVCMYNRIVDQYGVGDFQSIRSMTDFVWKKILNPNFMDITVENKFRRFEVLVPNGEQYHGVNNAIALNVVICLEVTHKCIIKENNDSYISCLYIYDTIKQIILSKSQNIDFITYEVIDKIDNSKIVQNEIKHVEGIIKELKQKELNKKLILKFKERALSNKYDYDSIPSLDEL